MQYRLLTTGALGLALALSTAVSASAQVQTDTTRRDTSTVRSTRSIPVSKEVSTQESTGAVAPMDTTTPAPDTTTMTPAPAPVDTTTPAPVDTTTQITTDTTTLATTVEPEPIGPVAGGWYFGLGGGALVPQGDYSDALSTGWSAGAMLGWRPVNSIWGVRLDANYGRLSAQESAGLSSDDQLTTWNAMLDLTLDFPIGQNGSSFYLLGGAGLHNFAWDFEGVDDDPNQSFDEVEDATDFGVNAGAGLNFAIGRTNLFVEGRFINVFNGNDVVDDARFIPISAGLKWFF